MGNYPRITGLSRGAYPQVLGRSRHFEPGKYLIMTKHPGFDPEDVHLKKNKSEELRIGLRKYLGYILLNLRVWEHNKREKEWYPTTKGVAVQVNMLPRILAELQRLEKDAWSEGHLTKLDYTSAGLEPPSIPKQGDGDK